MGSEGGCIIWIKLYKNNLWFPRMFNTRAKQMSFPSRLQYVLELHGLKPLIASTSSFQYGSMERSPGGLIPPVTALLVDGSQRTFYKAAVFLAPRPEVSIMFASYFFFLGGISKFSKGFSLFSPTGMQQLTKALLIPLFGISPSSQGYIMEVVS